jgi:hypothetical protein
MGLLDDAIREHLELKRRRGADPGVVAREQHEALDPVPRDPDVLVGDGADGDLPSHEAPEQAIAADGLPEGVNDATLGEPAPAGAILGGETEELDMRSVLDAPDTEAAAGDGGAEPTDEDSLEWEMPGDGAEQPALAEEPDEDVLEETPDFLRDTPEQDRLWFEQRPPRDFDFDK